MLFFPPVPQHESHQNRWLVCLPPSTTGGIHIAECIESILNQKYGNFEYLIETTAVQIARFEIAFGICETRQPDPCSHE